MERVIKRMNETEQKQRAMLPAIRREITANWYEMHHVVLSRVFARIGK